MLEDSQNTFLNYNATDNLVEHQHLPNSSTDSELTSYGSMLLLTVNRNAMVCIIIVLYCNTNIRFLNNIVLHILLDSFLAYCRLSYYRHYRILPEQA